MGTNGPAPKDPTQRVNRNKKLVDEVRVPAGKPGARPAMPAGTWHPNVVRWWDAWQTTPAAVTFADTEWERLLRAIPVAEKYWTAVDLGDAPAIYAGHRALLEAEKGLPATDYERRRAGIHVTLTAPAPVASPAERRERIRLA